MDPLADIIARAKTDPKHIVLAEGQDKRVVQGAVRAARAGIATITLLGAEDDVKPLIEAENDLIRIIDPEGDNPLNFAAEMVRNGRADGSVAGAVYTTPDVVRAALKIIGVHQNYDLVSSLFIMVMAETFETLKGGAIFSDCGLVIDPDAAQLADIAAAAADNAKMLLGLEPKIAMLSFATRSSARHAFVDKVETATHMLKEKRPELTIEGPVQFDAAIIPEISASKAPNSEVAGRANVFIFPDLNAGNIGYKIAQRIGGAKAIGPVLQGLNKPVNDLSRGCDAEDVFNMIAVTALQAQAVKD